MNVICRAGNGVRGRAALLILVAANGVMVAPSRDAHAQGVVLPDEQHLGGQRRLGLGPTIGFGGAGVTVAGALSPSFGLWISAGYQPLLVFGGLHDVTTFDVYSTAEVNLDAAIVPIHRGPRLDAGLLAGYRYSTLFRHGVEAGLIATYDFSRQVAGYASFVAEVFPQAEEQLRGAGYPGTPSLPGLQGGVGVGILFFP